MASPTRVDRLRVWAFDGVERPLMQAVPEATCNSFVPRVPQQDPTARTYYMEHSLNPQKWVEDMVQSVSHVDHVEVGWGEAEV
mmetsp:Transcript_26178/g.39794  ORF Transcript_26178/g.39794 Transcript_26178/m.39794 type:complete len:83 (-) Transcript_26178:306-554(-)